MPDMAQRSRRLYYGLHLAVFIIAVLAIVVFVNWIGFQRFVRIDMTATRQYSLSPQTRQVLSGLDEEVQMVMLFTAGVGAEEQQEQISDLIDEYARRSDGRIRTQQIDPAYDIAAYEKFAAQLRQRYEEQLAQTKKTINEGALAMEAVVQFGRTQAQPFAAATTQLTQASPGAAHLISQIAQLLQGLDKRLRVEDIAAEVQRSTESPLPDYMGDGTLISAPLQQIHDGLLTPAIEQFRKLVSAEDTPSSVKDFLLSRLDVFEPLKEQVSAALDAIKGMSEGEYEEVRRRVLGGNSVAVMTDKRVSVLALDDVYAPPKVEPGEVQPKPRFKGEEMLTGRLISLGMDVPPLVVFVNGSPQPATGPRGAYSNVAQSLSNMNFEVTEWSPAGRQTPWGMQPPQPKPQPAEGQTMIYIVLPPAPPSPQMPVNPADQQITQAVSEHLNSGYPALMFVAPSPMTRFGGSDPAAPLLEPFGIMPQADRLIFEAQVGRGGRVQPLSVIELSSWPDVHPISKAVAGLAGVLVESIPLAKMDDAPGNVQTWPLIETPAGTWADTNMQSPAAPTKDSPKPRGPFVAGMAVERDAQRLVVIADTMFATDRVTKAGRYDASGQVAYFLPYSANAELVANSVYWLAGMDDLIATTARTQDVRRFAPVSRSAQIALWWILLAGLPLGTLAAGGIVWMVRRK
jgi:hypothetical protein